MTDATLAIGERLDHIEAALNGIAGALDRLEQRAGATARLEALAREAALPRPAPDRTPGPTPARPHARGRPPAPRPRR